MPFRLLVSVKSLIRNNFEHSTVKFKYEIKSEDIQKKKKMKHIKM